MQTYFLTLPAALPVQLTGVPTPLFAQATFFGISGFNVSGAAVNNAQNIFLARPTLDNYLIQ